MPRKSVKYVVVTPEKPIKKESDKRVVFEALKELQESNESNSFTKVEAMEKMEEIQPETNSIQPPKTFARAWWNEFANKYGLIVDQDDQA